MKKIVITGGAGYIGAHIAVALAERDYEPIILDDFRNSERRAIEGIAKLIGRQPSLIDADCSDIKAVVASFEKYGSIHGIIHLAAYKAVGESVLEPMKYLNNNVGATTAVLQAMDKFGIENLVFSSSCTVYGEPENGVVKEGDPDERALSPYGYTKQIGERLMRDYLRSGRKGKFVSLRYFNPIGAHPSASIGELPMGRPNNLVPYITEVAAGFRDKLTVFGEDYATADGTCVRDYIHVMDVANAHLAAFEYIEKQDYTNSPRLFNIGTGRGSSVKEIIETFQRVNELKINVHYGARRDGDVAAIYADPSLAKSTLGWEAEYSIEDALRHAWEWQKKLGVK